MRRAAVAAVLVASLGTAGCDDQPADPGPDDDPGWALPQEGFCDDLAAEAGITAEVKETLSGDDEDLTAVCALVMGSSRVDLAVRVAEESPTDYENLVGERADGFIGFPDPEISTRPGGWWSQGTRYEDVWVDSVRLADLLLDDDLVVQLQYLEDIKPGDPSKRQARAREIADALDVAIADVLSRIEP